MTQTADPLRVNERLYKQIARLLDDLEAQDEDTGITIPQRINALIAIGRIQIMFTALKKAENEPVTGGKVRQYSTAFRAKTNAVGGRAERTRPTAVDLAAAAAAADDDEPDAA